VAAPDSVGTGKLRSWPSFAREQAAGRFSARDRPGPDLTPISTQIWRWLNKSNLDIDKINSRG
jgi:hypothetical protein